MTRFYLYTGPDEARKPTQLWIDLAVVIAIHLREVEVYIEAEGYNWTLRRDAVDTDALVAAWQTVRASR